MWQGLRIQETDQEFSTGGAEPGDLGVLG